MKTKFHHLFIALVLLALSTFNSQLSTVRAQGTAFTYSGQLQNNGSPASGAYNLTFTLFNTTNTNAVAIAGPVTNNALFITNGMFTVLIDFGPGVFTGETNWLQIGVETNGVSNFTTLSPRQQLTPAPNAIYAENAGSLRGFSVQQNTNGAPNFIGGSAGNFVSGGVVGATIGGGGDPNYGGIVFINSVTGNFGTVGGGANNTAALSATVGGGADNTANNTDATVGGGANNTASGQDATVSGGYQNTASGKLATVGGGYENTASSELATVGGGVLNIASGTGAFIGGGGYDGTSFSANNALGNASVIGGGLGNTISSGGTYDFIGGGAFNTASGIGSFVGGGGFDGTTTGGNTAIGNASVVSGGLGNIIQSNAVYATISGGMLNTNSGYGSSIGGGRGNSIQGSTLDNTFDAVIGGGRQNLIVPGASFSTIGGGNGNAVYLDGATNSTIAGGNGNVVLDSYGSIGGGEQNYIEPGGTYAAIPGGSFNTATGANSFAAGSQANAHDNNSFVWSDGAFVSSFGANTFTAHASGGFQFELASSTVAISASGTLSVPVLTITGGADVAEPFAMSSAAIPKGSVVIIDEEHPGQLKLSHQPYDTRVAGIVSGANGVNPGISLHQANLLNGDQNVALSGRVYVLAEASNGAIRPGDFLTTSSTPGYAMKAADHARAAGAILGKAMTGLSEGKGMVLVLVNLQ